MRKSYFVTVLAMAISLSFLSVSYAQGIIDFEDLPIIHPLTGPTIQSNGFNFYFAEEHAHILDDSQLGNPSNGTKHLDVDETTGNDNPVTMSRINGETFLLRSIDLAEWWSQPVSEVSVTGYLFGSGSVSTVLTLDGVSDGIGGVADFETFTFSSQWSGLTSVVFDGIGPAGNHNGWSIDNINVVPEPISSLLFITGGTLLAARRFWKKRRTS